MIKALIIEDEEPASVRLKNLLANVAPDIEVLNCLDSIESSVEWLKSNLAPDLIMLDIQLADGLSFDIFKQVDIYSFIIFTTAYDEYAIKAFELNSIDYLLKPIDKLKLERSIAKFRKLSKPAPQLNINELISAIESKKSNYKKRFLINIGSKIKSVETINIAYFYVLEKCTFLKTIQGKNYPIDFSLDKLELLINPDLFFRINRQNIINYNVIEKISVFSKSRIKIETIPQNEHELMVSANKSHSFRMWLDR